VVDQPVGDPATPLKVTELDPCGDPKLLPEIVTEVFTAPEVGLMPVMLGATNTVKFTPLLFAPLAYTTTFPVVAPAGTVVATLPALQLVAVARVPLNVTMPLPWVEPKLLPEIVTGVPTTPDETLRPLMLGLPSTVKLLALLFTPLAKTTTFPVVAPAGTVATMLLAPQLLTAAAVPLNLTVPLPWLDPKLLPAIVTVAVTAPEVGDTLVMVGAETTEKLTPLVFTPLAFTSTCPVVAVAGTVVVMLLALQVVTVAVFPLNLTVLVP
jgi:hypothetical protein